MSEEHNVKCDMCGTKQEYEQSIVINHYPVGWLKLSGRDLCPVCKKIVLAVIDGNYIVKQGVGIVPT